MIRATELGILEPHGEVAMQDLVNGIHVGIEIGTVRITCEECVTNLLGDLGFSATGNRARLVQTRRSPLGGDERPQSLGAVEPHAGAKPGWIDVIGASSKGNGLFLC